MLRQIGVLGNGLVTKERVSSPKVASLQLCNNAIDCQRLAANYKYG
jgi:hypothetical protein